MALKALIFDCDGTLAETEEAHRTAFNMAFARIGLDWHWSVDRYRDLLKVTGGRERIAHYIAEQGLSNVDIPRLHDMKNANYASLIERGEILLRPGVIRVMQAAEASGIALAIATTTSRSNLDNLIAASALSRFDFTAVVTGEDVTRKKPDPEAYHAVLKQLSLDPGDCVAFEDSRNGLLAAHAAGIRSVITPSVYTMGENFDEASMLLADLGHIADLTALDHLCNGRRA
jgi:HAD superfamily hydrolase (TIGR01509 family)